MNRIQNQIIEILEDLTQEISKNFNYQRTDKQQLCVMGYYSTIVENTTACAHLMSRPAFSGLPIIIRSNIESLLDLKNAIEDPEYYKKLWAKYLRQRSYYFKSKFHRAEEKYGSSSEEYKKNKTEYDKILDELNVYKKDDIEPVDIREKFKFLDSLEDHETSYSSFCLEIPRLNSSGGLLTSHHILEETFF